jgi:hypothetical protein
MTTRKKIFIVAGTAEEFLAYKRKKVALWSQKSTDMELDYFPEYIYVSDVSQLRGLEDVTGYFIGSYASRPDIEEIKLVIAMIKNRPTYQINNELNLPPLSSTTARSILINGVRTTIDDTVSTAFLDGTVSGLTSGSAKVTRYTQFENDTQKMKALENFFDSKNVKIKGE